MIFLVWFVTVTRVLVGAPSLTPLKMCVVPGFQDVYGFVT